MDVWKRAMDSFKEFESDPRIQNKSLLTLVDFRIEMTNSRLWVVNMDTKTVEMHGPVSHGVRSGSRTGAGEHFSNNTGSNQSSIGPFVTRGEYKSDLGGLTQAPSLRIEGLSTTNKASKDRGIVFHGATYMAWRRVGTSHGCFATDPRLNTQIIRRIKNGTFVFDYAGDVCK